MSSGQSEQMSTEKKLEIAKEEAFVNLLREVKRVLDKYGVEFWLDAGTMLGAVREGRFLPWEHDIDLITWDTNLSGSVKRLIATELSDKRFQVNLFRDKMNIQDRQRNVLADLHYYRLIKDKATTLRLEPKNLLGQTILYFTEVLSAPHYYEDDLKTKPGIRSLVKSTLLRFSLKLPSPLRTWLARISIAIHTTKIGARDVSWVIPADYFRDLATITFYGMEFMVPAKKEEYLAFRFGEAWRTPRRDWDPNRDDGALISVQEKRKCSLTSKF